MNCFKNETIREILKEYRKIAAIDHVSLLASWDAATYMPEKGVKYRAEAKAVLAQLSQGLITDSHFVSLVNRAEKEDLNDYERGVVRVLKRSLKYYLSVPSEFLAEMKKAATVGEKAWERAKGKSDFSIFRPHLEKWVEYQRKLAEYLGYDEHPYDALLDLYDEGLTYREVKRVFSELVPFVSDFLKRIVESDKFSRTHELEDVTYERKNMEELNRIVLSVFGADWSRFRMDVSAHPFTTSFESPLDVRITTWYQGKDFRRSLLAAVHEWGHALYEMQIDEQLAFTPLYDDLSFTIHESQSRFWENHIGRSFAFVEAFYDDIVFAISSVSAFEPEEVYKYFNLVRPELIRVEADEISYMLHIALRYELEVALLDGDILVSELPQAWNEKMEKYLGVVPPDDAHGVLQDVHWSEYPFGYFPTYALGTILSAQIRHAMENDLGPIEDLVRAKNFAPIREWLREKIHRWGSTYPPKELTRMATGEKMNPEYFMRYVKEHYGEIYKL